MDIKELRIGNLVEWNRKPFLVCRIFNDAIENEFYCKPIDQIHPIPLTEEWLVKFGLIERYNKGEWSWFNCKKYGQWKSYTELYLKDGAFIYLGDYKPIKHVHQLQNLYFALTGEELN